MNALDSANILLIVVTLDNVLVFSRVERSQFPRFWLLKTGHVENIIDISFTLVTFHRSMPVPVNAKALRNIDAIDVTLDVVLVFPAVVRSQIPRFSLLKTVHALNILDISLTLVTFH